LGIARDDDFMPEIGDALSVLLALLVMATFAAMIWAGNHTH